MMKVQSSVRMPSPRLSSFTRRITRKSRKKVMEMREFSSAFWKPLAQRQELQQHDSNEGPGHRGCYAEGSLHCSLSWYCSLGFHSRAPQGHIKAAQACPVSHGGEAAPQGLSTSASAFSLPGLAGIRDGLYPLHPSTTSPHVGKRQFPFDFAWRRRTLSLLAFLECFTPLSA